MISQKAIAVATSVVRVGFVLGLATTVVGFVSLPTMAQTARPAPLEDLQTKDGSDFFNGRGNGQTGGVMNFIQNAIIGTPRSMDEFTAEQKENFNDAAAQFRKRQAEQIRQQQTQNSPTSPAGSTTNPKPN